MTANMTAGDMGKDALNAYAETLPFDPRKAADPDLTLPDLTDAVEGWRAWTVHLDDEPRFGLSPKLYSVTRGDYFWTPKRASLAVCERGCAESELDDEGNPNPRVLPGENCSCGFYCAKDVKHLLSMGANYADYDIRGGQIKVVGKVALWGKVVEGTQGYRSAKAYPVSLYVPFEAAHIAKPLADGYGCRVAPMNFLRAPNGKRRKVEG
jgi:hypothetical protein